MLAAAEAGLLPPLLQKRNKAGVQSGILMLQGTIVTVLAAIFIIVPNVSAAFVALMLVTYIPALSLWLPSVFR